MAEKVQKGPFFCPAEKNPEKSYFFPPSLWRNIDMEVYLSWKYVPKVFNFHWIDLLISKFGCRSKYWKKFILSSQNKKKSPFLNILLTAVDKKIIWGLAITYKSKIIYWFGDLANKFGQKH